MLKVFSTMNKRTFLSFASLFVLYFIQAMPYGFQSRYLPLLMRKQGISLTHLGLFKLLLLPWVCKFFIAAFLVDAYRTKRFWLFASLIVLSIGSFTAGFISDFNLLAIVIFLLNWASVVQDICVDWFAMNALDKEDLGLGNTIQVGSFKLGTLFSGGFLVYTMDFLSMKATFTIIGSIYLLSLVLLNLSFFKSESTSSKQSEQSSESSSSTEANQNLKEKLAMIHKSPATYWTCIFVLIYKLGEQSSLNFLPIFLLDRKVPSQSIGLWTGIIGQSFSIGGSILSGLVLKKTNAQHTTLSWLKWSLWARILPITYIAFAVIITEQTFSADSEDFKFSEFSLGTLYLAVVLQLFFSGFLTTITFTMMMEVSFLADKQIQATHFSLLATCEVLGKLLFQPVVSMFTDTFGYSVAFVLFIVLYVLSILPVYSSPSILEQSREVSNDDDSKKA